jgi:rhamnose transport system ATP-binding protein
VSPSESKLLELLNVSHSFPGVRAIDAVSFDVRRGEVHGLVGENGAGKSTLINIISGVIRPDAGNILLEGQANQLTDPVIARKLGVVTVHQEAEFFPSLSVAENMALTQGLPIKQLGMVDWKSVDHDATRAVAEIDEQIDVRMPAARLSIAHRHMTQVAIAVSQQAKVVILDEPTSALSAAESHWLFQQIERLKAAGTGILYISHRQEEIFSLADRVTVLRDGRRIWTKAKEAIDRDGLISAMVGRQREADDGQPSFRPKPGELPESKAAPRLHVRGLGDARGRVREVDLQASAGEIVGIYGLIGSGRSEFAQTLFGLARKSSGTVEIDGRKCDIRRPRDAVRAGLAYLPEDRLRQGLCRGLSLRANAVLSSLARWSTGPVASARKEKNATAELLERLSVRHRSIGQPIGQLSGGNQQKVVLGRCLLTEPKVLLLDEPTRGVDVGAKAEIHRLLRRLVNRGQAVVMISSELPEVMENSDRVVVFRDGTVAGQFDPRQATPDEIATAALPNETSSIAQSASQSRSKANGATARRRTNWLSGELGLLVIVIGLMIWLGLTTDGFFEPGSLMKLAANASLGVILGLAAATVIIAGGIDISVGSLLALAAVCAGMVLKSPFSTALTIPLAILVACGVGCVGGLLNGALSLAGRVHPIVVTLGTMSIYRGIVVALRGQHDINDLPQAFTWLAVHPPSGFRGSILFAALVVGAAYFWLAHMRSGRHLYALGSSPTAARLVGISRVKLTLIAFAVGGLMIGVAAIVELARSGSMQSRLGTGWELQAIAIAVIGGVRITGGQGSVLGVVLGAFLMQLVQTALVRWEIQGDQVDVVVGGMILVAILLNHSWRRDE